MRFESSSLRNIIKILVFLNKNGFTNYSLVELEKHVEIIKVTIAKNSIRNPKFPMNFNSKEGAQIISAFMFDGGITKDLFPFYANNDSSLVRKLIKNIELVVGQIDYNERRDNRERNIKTINLEVDFLRKSLIYLIFKNLINKYL